MEFLGVGYQEFFLVLVLLLVVVGPERLPAMAYQIGRAVRTMQQYARAVRNEFSDEFQYIEEQYKTVKGQVDDTRQVLREEDRKLQAELRSSTAVQLPPLFADTPPAAAAAPLASELESGSSSPAEDVPAPAPAAAATPEPAGDTAPPPLVF